MLWLPVLMLWADPPDEAPPEPPFAIENPLPRAATKTETIKMLLRMIDSLLPE
jgi:hypothetical protein